MPCMRMSTLLIKSAEENGAPVTEKKRKKVAADTSLSLVRRIVKCFSCDVNSAIVNYFRG